MIALTIYEGLAGDRNARAMRGARSLGDALGEALDLVPQHVGTPQPPASGGWAAQLQIASKGLRDLGAHMEDVLNRGGRPLTAMGRCAAALATLPPVARRYGGAAIVWFDAHGDSNVPAPGRSSENAYLGGMVITGAAGLWDSGLGGDVNLAQVILVGSRDLDPPEWARIESGEIVLVPPGPGLGARLRDALGGRAAYVHLDCDVMEAGLVPTEYQVSGGLSWSELSDACALLAEHEIVGLEIAEFEGEWPDGRQDDGARILSAVAPLLRKLAQA